MCDQSAMKPYKGRVPFQWEQILHEIKFEIWFFQRISFSYFSCAFVERPFPTLFPPIVTSLTATCFWEAKHFSRTLFAFELEVESKQ